MTLRLLITRTVAALVALECALCLPCVAEDTSVSLTVLTENGEHFKALSAFYGQPETERSLAERLAVARSAWALGLVEQARETWDNLFAQPELKGPEYLHALLGRAIMELQEGRFDVARRFAEQAADRLDASDLRAQFWLVIAESLREEGITKRSELFYRKAAEESGSRVREEALLLLGGAQLKLGMLSEARYALTSIPTISPYAPQALRTLVEIDYTQRDYDGVLTWINEGRQSYPAQFGDPWLYYVEITALIELGNAVQARKVLGQFRARHSTTNAWYSLSEAAVEAALLVQGTSLQRASMVMEER